MVYNRRHPTYTTSNTSESLIHRQTNISRGSTNAGMKKSVLKARETITGQSFALENYTIKEEISDDEDH